MKLEKQWLGEQPEQVEMFADLKTGKKKKKSQDVKLRHAWRQKLHDILTRAMTVKSDAKWDLFFKAAMEEYGGDIDAAARDMLCACINVNEEVLDIEFLPIRNSQNSYARWYKGYWARRRGYMRFDTNEEAARRLEMLHSADGTGRDVYIRRQDEDELVRQRKSERYRSNGQNQDEAYDNEGMPYWNAYVDEAYVEPQRNLQLSDDGENPDETRT